MAFSSINFNFFGGSPTINNFNAPPTVQQNTPPPPPDVVETPDEDDPAFFVSFSRESEFSLAIGDTTEINISQSSSTTISGDPSIFAFIGQPAPADEPEPETVEETTAATVIEEADDDDGVSFQDFVLEADIRAEARVQQFREEVFAITSGNRFSRPEQAILGRVFQETDFEFSASFFDDESGFEINIDIDIDIEFNASFEDRIREDIREINGNAFGIERRLLGLFEEGLSDSLLEGRSFDSLQDLFEDFRPEREGATGGTGSTGDTGDSDDRGDIDDDDGDDDG